MTDHEFDAMMADPDKRIEGDLEWREDDDRSPAVEFRAAVQSGVGYPLFVCGRLNRQADKLSFVIVHRGVGRVYALDLGADHRNPTGELVGEKHKHRWCEQFKDKNAYVPEDITATQQEPVDVWRQFCEEAQLEHRGQLKPPPPEQELLL